MIGRLGSKVFDERTGVEFELGEGADKNLPKGIVRTSVSDLIDYVLFLRVRFGLLYFLQIESGSPFQIGLHRIFGLF